MKDKYLLIAGTLFLLIFVLSISGCLNSEEKENKTIENATDTNNTIVVSEKDVKVIKSVRLGFENLTQTGKVQINVGDVYVYHVWDNLVNALNAKESSSNNEICDPAEADIYVYVDKIERINKSDYYIVRIEEAEAPYMCYSKSDNRFTETENAFIYGKTVIGIDKDNISHHIPIPKKDIQKPKTKSNKTYNKVFRRLNPVTDLFFFSNWITCLDEKTKFIIDEVRERNGKKQGYYVELRVIGSEKVNGFDCFKIEEIYKEYSETYSQLNRYILYVDKKQRVIVKKDIYLYAHEGYIPMQRVELKEIRHIS